METTSGCTYNLMVLKTSISISVRNFVPPAATFNGTNRLSLLCFTHYSDAFCLQNFSKFNYHINWFFPFQTDNYLYVQFKENAYCNVLSWIRYNLDARRVQLPELITHIRLRIVPLEFL
uniref:BACK domain-containing protein n=1 Tax=Glossina palpalis gambiensis TaxID=67801 RepID=A0A1B0BBA4_9MUSC